MVTLVGCLVLPCDGGSSLQYLVDDSGLISFFSHVVGRPAAREEVDETDTGLVVVTIRRSQSNAVVLSHASISANIRAVV